MRPRQSNRKREGAAAVEFAVVSLAFFMFFFGIVEFAQIVWINNIMDSAAREGARYAAVNTGDGSALTTNVRNTVLTRLAGVENRFVGFNSSTDITVTAVDPTTGNQLLDPYGNPLAPEDTGFGQFIRVRVVANYQPLLPGLLNLPTSMSLQGTSVINSESN